MLFCIRLQFKMDCTLLHQYVLYVEDMGMGNAQYLSPGEIKASVLLLFKVVVLLASLDCEDNISFLYHVVVYKGSCIVSLENKHIGY